MCKRRANHLIVAAAVFALGSIVLPAQNITIPNTFVNGTVADATQVNANFSALSANALNRAAGVLSGTATPSADNTIDLGSSGVRFANIYGVQFRGGGANLTALTAANLTGTVPQAQLGPALLFGVVGGRCSAQTATPVPTSDVTAATSIYFTPYGSWAGVIGLYDGSTAWNIRTLSELTLALGADPANTNFDLFVFDNSGTPTLERLAWTNDTTRATALVLQNNYYVKSGATTRRYVCTYRTTAAAGQTEDSLAKRFVWNAYNRVPRVLRVTEPTDTWTWDTAAWHQANANAANQLAVVVGLPEVEVSVDVRAHVANASGSAKVVYGGIGEDVTNAIAAGSLAVRLDLLNGASAPLTPSLRKAPAIGYHIYTWLEFGAVGLGATWAGDNGTPTLLQSGIHGRMEN